VKHFRIQTKTKEWKRDFSQKKNSFKIEYKYLGRKKCPGNGNEIIVVVSNKMIIAKRIKFLLFFTAIKFDPSV